MARAAVRTAGQRACHPGLCSALRLQGVPAESCPRPARPPLLSVLCRLCCPFWGVRSFDIYFAFPVGNVLHSLSSACASLLPGLCLGEHVGALGARVGGGLAPWLGWGGELRVALPAQPVTCPEGVTVTALCLCSQGLARHPACRMRFCPECWALSSGLLRNASSSHTPSPAPPDFGGLCFQRTLIWAAVFVLSALGTQQARPSREPLEGLTVGKGSGGRWMGGSSTPLAVGSAGVDWGSAGARGAP